MSVGQDDDVLPASEAFRDDPNLSPAALEARDSLFGKACVKCLVEQQARGLAALSTDAITASHAPNVRGPAVHKR